MTEMLCSCENETVLYSDIVKITRPQLSFAVDRIGAVSAFVWLKDGTQIPYFSRFVGPSYNKDKVLCEANREHDLRIDQWRAFLASGSAASDSVGRPSGPTKPSADAMIVRAQRELHAYHAELNAHKWIPRHTLAQRELAACRVELNAHKRIRRDMVARVADAISCLESPYVAGCITDALKHLKDIKLV